VADTPGQGGGTAGKQQVPHFVRNDKPEGEGIPVVIQAVADDAGAREVESKSPLLAKDARNGAPSVSSLAAGAAVRSDGRTGAAVSTQSGVAHGDVVETARAGAPAAHVQGQDSEIRDASDETITILAQAESRMPGNLVVNLAIADIDKNPFQTRYVDDDEKLEELSDSIKANGVVQPIMVRPGDEEGRYILVLGERRLLASKKAGKTTIPALVRRVSLQQAAEMTIIENLQREDLSALEQAEAFRVLSKEFSLTQAQIGEWVGLSRESVSNYMRLLKLPVMVMEQLAHKQIGFSEAKELLKLEDPDLIQKTADYIVAKHMTLDQVETLIMRMTGLLDPVPGMPGQVVERKKSGARWVDPNVKAAQLDMERMLGVKVRIRDRKGKGRIVIEYSTVDDYERVVEMLRGRKG
jgi:ParB family transcriptional regulator, chromosome partitioning protein